MDTRIWFVTDLHGSTLCFRKFLNSIRSRKRPDVLVIGGDLTGKTVVPIIAESRARWFTLYEGKRSDFVGEGEVSRFKARLADCGEYGWTCTVDALHAVRDDPAAEAAMVAELKRERLVEWMELADQRLAASECRVFINAGNDDPFCIDPILDGSSRVVRPEGRVVEIDDRLTMISCGYANPTPWDSPRDIPEEALFDRIAGMALRVPDLERCIFNLHAPPWNSVLDRAPLIDHRLTPRLSGAGVEMQPVGSRAVRRAIEEYQPCVSLHGHVHEQHACVRIGRTLCFNPGSEYESGRLRGVLLRFADGQLTSYSLTREVAPTDLAW
jgi:Icc-related predicted phosphoesterase